LGGIANDVEQLQAKRRQGPPGLFPLTEYERLEAKTGTPIYYQPGDKSDNRSAFGKALLSVADANAGRDDFVMAVFDCDLSGSVKTQAFARKYPRSFFQCGISEHTPKPTTRPV
jgi:transketolase